MRNNMPLLAYIGGKPAHFTSKDHNFLPGETIEKQLIVINNSRETVTCDCQWSLACPQALAGGTDGQRPDGPAGAHSAASRACPPSSPGTYETQHAPSSSATAKPRRTPSPSMSCRRRGRPKPAAKIALFDPKGETAKLLDAHGAEVPVASMPTPICRPTTS